MRVKTNDLARRFREDWFQFNLILFFILLCLIAISLLFIKKSFIIDQIAAFEILNSRGDSSIINLIFGLQYLSVPVFYGWKLTITTTFLWMSSFFFGYKLVFTRIWKLVLLMEIIFVLPEILKIIWFVMISPSQDFEEITAFYPLSLQNFTNSSSLPSKWLYPLKALNIFEVIYWFLLVLGIYSLSKKQLKIAFYIVFIGYIIPFFIWLTFYIAVSK